MVTNIAMQHATLPQDSALLPQVRQPLLPLRPSLPVRAALLQSLTVEVRQ
jgi:hypothetical protein